VDKSNEKAETNVHKVRKFRLIPLDFSAPGGELTPTLKLRRSVTVKKYQQYIDDIYN